MIKCLKRTELRVISDTEETMSLMAQGEKRENEI